MNQLLEALQMTTHQTLINGRFAYIQLMCSIRKIDSLVWTIAKMSGCGCAHGVLEQDRSEKQ